MFFRTVKNTIEMVIALEEEERSNSNAPTQLSTVTELGIDLLEGRTHKAVIVVVHLDTG